MDLGATVCTRAKPRCAHCPLQRTCVAHRDGRVERLPERKPARALPTRKTVMLLLRDRSGRILLERRPPTGVWALLWSLPEAENDAAARHHLGKSIRLHALAPFTHTFSHYRLDITPMTGIATATRGVADAPGQCWLHPREAAALGLPAPVRKLIENLPEKP